MQPDQQLHTLKEKGHKLTPQRAIILDVIKKKKGHVKTDTIINELKKEQPYIDISTIYRTLSLLTKIGIINEVRLSSGVEYELVHENTHQHLICRECGQALEIHSPLFQQLQTSIEKEYQFSLDIRHIALFGICNNCLEKSK